MRNFTNSVKHEELNLSPLSLLAHRIEPIGSLSRAEWDVPDGYSRLNITANPHRRFRFSPIAGMDENSVAARGIYAGQEIQKDQDPVSPVH